EGRSRFAPPVVRQARGQSWRNIPPAQAYLFEHPEDLLEAVPLEGVSSRTSRQRLRHVPQSAAVGQDQDANTWSAATDRLNSERTPKPRQGRVQNHEVRLDGGQDPEGVAGR